MYLKSITLENVRSIEHLHLDFSAGRQNRKWTILLGENGCGKSSVLRSIALLLAGSDGILELLEHPDSWIRTGARSCRISGVIQTKEGEKRELMLMIKRGASSKRVYLDNLESLSLIDRAIGKSSRNYFVAGYGVSRRPPESNETTFRSRYRSNSRARNVASLFSTRNPLVSLEDWAMDSDYFGGPSSFEMVRRTLGILLPGMKLDGIDKERRTLMFSTSDGRIPFKELSDGYQSMAAWCGDLLYTITHTFPGRVNPLSIRGVLLIDELDLHLHPVWRRNLIEFLDNTFVNLQVIATTHSALTAQQSGEGELFVIHRNKRTQLPELIPFIGEPRKMMLHQLLMSPMFGLQTMDSVEVEEAKKEVRLLSNKPQEELTVAEKEAFNLAQKTLQDAPNWDLVPESQKEQTALLKLLKQELSQHLVRHPVMKIEAVSRLKKIGKSDD